MTGARSTSITVDVPQWRIGDDLAAAAAAARSVAADGLQIDFGGAHRGPRLDQGYRLDEARQLASSLPVTALAVNHANDLGLVTDDGRPNPAATALLRTALRCAVTIGIPVLHVPGFRRSAPSSPARVAGTAAVLREAVDDAAVHGITVAYESALDGHASIALAETVGRGALGLVLDVGNLVDAGNAPADFATAVGGRLHACAHVKASVRAPSVEPVALLPQSPAIRSVLVENDYRAVPARLAADVTAARNRLSQNPEGAQCARSH
ncbi:sugar phosphate isomerase/epimerase family protein [Tsukamurella ocularis]|uniref:sugar phosphate isomerase/epimerase family protein n=1 Tax=Tsukamurella ocularis TaxID=1970234 RepID=UPI002167AB24|nr:sugar phosphate isomerase/epimerase [Tsukamurella ocularis]MCS3780018.1 sugar phosphate isomerase/epimerase [Tsukamurella ocularis]MCS3788582.1 sugar phosphate isomerase/epimerase [Tsukamurella ocularis]MCS3849792.1 sugar phosphate isomerase/epimerase [Tsukamurella ocularis]